MEPPAASPAEPGGVDELLDPFKTQLAQPIADGRFKTEGGYRKERDRLPMFPGLNRDRPASGNVECDRVRAPGGVGHRELNRQAKCGDPSVQVLQQGALG